MNCYQFGTMFIPSHSVANWSYEVSGVEGRRMANLRLNDMLGARHEHQWCETDTPIPKTGIEALQCLLVK